MDFTLHFRVAHSYAGEPLGIGVPVVLSRARRRLRTLAKIDTGADVCVFKREHGEDLQIDIDSGLPLQIATATGSFLAYGHHLSVATLGFDCEALVYFAFAHDFPRNVLGRRGWLEQMRLGLVDYDRKIYLARYGDEG